MRRTTLALAALALIVAAYSGTRADDKADVKNSSPASGTPYPLLRKPLYPGGRRADDKADVEKRSAIAQADENGAEYQKAIEANKTRPGAVPESEIERLHRIYSDSTIVVLRDEVRSLRAEIKQLREQVKALAEKRVKIQEI